MFATGPFLGAELMLPVDQVGDVQAIGGAIEQGLGAEVDRLAVLEPLPPSGGDRLDAVMRAGFASAPAKRNEGKTAGTSDRSG